MSLFIVPEDQFYSPLGSESCKKSTIYIMSQKSSPVDLEESGNYELKCLKQTILCKIIQQNQEQRHVFLLCDLSYKLKGLFSIKVNNKKQIISFFVDILAEDDNYYKAANAFQVTQICRNFIQIQHHAHFKNALFCLKLNTSKRQIKIQLPFYLNYAWTNRKTPSIINQTINSIFRTLIKPHLSLIQLSLVNIRRYQGRERSQYPTFQKQSKNLQLLKTFTSISHLSSHIFCQSQVDSTVAHTIKARQQASFAKILKNKKVLQPQVIKNSYLFAYPISYQICNSQNFTFQQLIWNDHQNPKSKLYFPIPPQSQHPHDNYMIYNTIELKQINQEQLQKINKGGFADIYLTQMSFSYPYAYNFKTPSTKTQRPILNQRVVIKRQIPSKELFNSVSKSTYQSRREHQFKIIQQLKKGKSIFLPKYYFPTNMKKLNSPIFQNCLLIEYIPFKTLGELLQNNAKNLSLHSKLNLMFYLCQGLRYLRDFKIVHLDIKPNNILTYYNSFIKLIDFGQSYHPDVCMKGYKPGFTIPYSPPQIFNDQIEKFNSKSDVFSLGVVLYQMLFSEFPFDFYKSTTEYNEQMKKNLQQGWYYSPEQKQSYGEGQILRILINLISKCLSFQPEQRPELDWIAFILKSLLQIVL